MSSLHMHTRDSALEFDQRRVFVVGRVVLVNNVFKQTIERVFVRHSQLGMHRMFGN